MDTHATSVLSEATARAVIDRLLVREGGVADIGDGAGVTRFGQTQGWLDKFQLPVPATQEQARQNYRAWLTKTRLDMLPDDLRFADAVIDYAVNSGEAPAIRALQQAIGLPAKLQDGVIGPVTIAKWAALSSVAQQWRDAVFAARLRTIGAWAHSDPTHAVPLIHGVMDRIATALET